MGPLFYPPLRFYLTQSALQTDWVQQLLLLGFNNKYQKFRISIAMYTRPRTARKRKSVSTLCDNTKCYLSVSKIEKSTGLDTKTLKKPKVFKVPSCNNVKSILLVRCYEPQKLRHCTVKDHKKYAKFFDTFGSCGADNLYSSSLNLYFRECRKDVRQQISELLENVTEEGKIIKLAQLDERIKKLELMAEHLKESADIVAGKSPRSDNKNPKKLIEKESHPANSESKKLKLAFEYFQEYLKNLLDIFKKLHMYIAQLYNQLQMSLAIDKADKSETSTSTSIFRMEKNSKIQITKELAFCLAHPQASLMNKAFHKIEGKFDSVAKQARACQAILASLKQIRGKINKQSCIMNLSLSQSQSTVQKLEQILHLINTAEQMTADSSGSNIILGSFKQLVDRQKSKTKKDSENLLSQLKTSSLSVVYWALREIKQQSIQTCMNDSGARIKQVKRRLLTLAKLFKKLSDPRLYQYISKFIKESSQSGFQKIYTFLEALDDILKQIRNKKTQNLSEVLLKLIGIAEKFQSSQAILAQKLRDLVISLNILTDNMIEGTSEALVFSSDSVQKTSQRLRSYIQVLKFSEQHASPLLMLPKYPEGQFFTHIQESHIKNVIETNYSELQVYASTVFLQACEYSKQLMRVTKDLLVLKLGVKMDHLVKDPIHSFSIFKDFYQTVNNSRSLSNALTRQSLEKLTSFLSESMTKCDKLCNSKEAKQFLEWIFENKVAQVWMAGTAGVRQLIGPALNTKLTSKKLDEATIRQLKQSQELLGEIIKYSGKFVREKSYYDYYFEQQIELIRSIILSQHRVAEFLQEVTRNSCIDTRTLSNWVDSQFCHRVLQEQVDVNKPRADARGYIDKHLQTLQYYITESKKMNLEYALVRGFYHNKEILEQLRAFLLNTGSRRPECETYAQLLSTFMKLLRQKEIPHVALYSMAEEPALLLLNTYEHNYEQLCGLVESKFRISGQTIQRKDCHAHFVPFQVRARDEFQSSPLFSVKEDHDSSTATPLRHHNSGQIIEEMNLEQQSNVKESLSPSRPSRHHEEAMSPKKSSRPQYQSRNAVPFFSYYKVTFMASLTAFAAKNKSYCGELQILKRQARADKLILAFDYQQPQRQLSQHLRALLSILNQNKSNYLFSHSRQETRPEILINNLLNAINKASNKYQDTMKVIKQLFDQLQYSYNFLNQEKDEKGQGNLIILCRTPGDKFYGYANLVSSSLLAPKNPLNLQLLKETQHMFLISIMSSKKQELIDEIKRQVADLNAQIKSSHTSARDDVTVYQSYNLVNLDQMNSKVETYLQQNLGKCPAITPITSVNYDSYTRFIEQICSIMTSLKHEVYRVCIDGRQNQPIYVTTDPSDLGTYQNNREIECYSRKLRLLPEAYTHEYVKREGEYMVRIECSRLARYLQKEWSDRLSAITPKQSLRWIYDFENSHIHQRLGKIQQNLRDLDAMSNNSKQDEIKMVLSLGEKTGTCTDISIDLQKPSKINQLLEAMRAVEEYKKQYLHHTDFEEQQKERRYIKDLKKDSKQQYSKRVDIPPNLLGDLALKLAQANVLFRKLSLNGKIVAIFDSDKRARDVIEDVLPVASSEGLKFNQDSVIQPFFIRLGLSKAFQKFLRDQFYSSQLQMYSIQVNTPEPQRISIRDVLSLVNDPFQIQCSYPRRSIDIKLIKVAEGNSPVDVTSCIIKHYKYGATYLLTSFEEKLTADMQALQKPLRQEQQDPKKEQPKKEQPKKEQPKMEQPKMEQPENQQKQNKRDPGRPYSKSCFKRVIQRFKRPQQNEKDQILEISVTLSQGAQQQYQLHEFPKQEPLKNQIDLKKLKVKRKAMVIP